jgi:hypothetical protein
VFAAHGRVAKDQFKDTLVPVIAHVGGTHKRISNETHPSLLRGVILFDKKSRALEDAARREQDQVVSTYARVTVSLWNHHCPPHELLLCFLGSASGVVFPAARRMHRERQAIRALRNGYQRTRYFFPARLKTLTNGTILPSSPTT